MIISYSNHKNKSDFIRFITSSNKIILLILVIPTLVFSQDIIKNFEVLNLKSSLTSQSYNFYVNNDSLNNIWISSIDGLNRYDGKRIKNYFPSENTPKSLIDGNILSDFFSDKKGNIWFSSSQAIYRYNKLNDNFDLFQIESIPEGPYYLLFYDVFTQNIWFRINKKLFVTNTSAIDDYKYIGTYDLRTSCKIYQTKNKDLMLFITKKNGLDLIKLLPNGKIILEESLIKGDEVSSVNYVNNELLFIGTNQGIINFNFKDKKSNLLSIYPELNNVVDIEYDGKDKIVIATLNNGLFIHNLASGTWKRLNMTLQGLNRKFNYPIDKIAITENKILWVSTISSGIFFTDLSDKNFKILLNNNFDSNENNPVRAISEDKDMNLLSLSDKGIFKITKNSKIDYSPFPPSHFGKYLTDLTLDSKNRLWIGSEKGLFENPNYSPINTINESIHYKCPPVFKISEILEKCILISTMDGIYILNENTNKINKEQTIPNNYGLFSWIINGLDPNTILINKEDKGFFILKYEEGSFYEDAFIEFTPYVTQIEVDSIRKIIWISSLEGIYKITKDNKDYKILKLGNLPFNSSRGLILDNRTGDLWIANNKGIVQLSSIGEILSSHNHKDGLLETEFTFRTSLKSSKGEFYFGTVNGLVQFNPNKISIDSFVRKPIITEILINDKTPKKDISCEITKATNINFIKSISQTYQENTLSFRFAALDYTDPDANEFKYRITPTETEWVHSGTENFARYANLAPGDYTFEVDATNSDGIWSNKPAQLDITILPPWYQTWWFRTLAALGIAEVVFLIYRNRVQQIQKEADFKRKEAEYKQLAAETETAVLRLQMNPHFIFNSMNSISSYLLQKDIETANDYLGRFAKLMRKILTVAEEPYLPLYDEIELLEQYMQAEAMRFEEKFHYEFIVADAIDTDEVLIPTMILQPFVENAIWHGISSKKGKGNIEIRFELENEKLICSITDNGIGRKAASQKSSSSHESKAISITQRRLNLLVSEHSLSFQPSLVIEDLVSPQNQPIGTKVILTLPQI